MAEQKFSTVFESVFIQKGAAETKRAVMDLNDSYSTLASVVGGAALSLKVITDAQLKELNSTRVSKEEYNKLTTALTSTAEGQKQYASAVSQTAATLQANVKAQKDAFYTTVESNKSTKNLIITEKVARLETDNAEKVYKRFTATLRQVTKAKQVYETAAASGNVEATTAAQLALDKALQRVQTTGERAGSAFRILDQTYQNVTGGTAAWRKELERTLLSVSDYDKALAMNAREHTVLSSQLKSVTSASEQYIAITSRLAAIQVNNNLLSKEKARILREEAAAIKKVEDAERKRRKIEGKGSGGDDVKKPSKQDAFFLANMRRLGIISPQIAQMSYVMQLFTSKSMVATVAVIGIAAAMIKLGTTSIKEAANLQKYRVTLQALSTHGWALADTMIAATQSLGKAVSVDMQTYAAGSIYALDKVAMGVERLVGYGIDMRFVNREIEMLGDLALGDSERLENLAVAYGQVFGQGKARAQEMYQFVNAGIPIFDLLAAKMGKSTAEIMDMTRNGEISFEIVKDLLKDLTKEGGKYHDLMKQIADLSYEGNMTKYLNEMKLLFANIGDHMLPTVTAFLVRLNESIANMRTDVTRDTITKDYKLAQEHGTEWGKKHFFDSIGLTLQDKLLTDDAKARKYYERFEDTGKAVNIVQAIRSAQGTVRPGSQAASTLQRPADNKEYALLKEFQALSNKTISPDIGKGYSSIAAQEAKKAAQNDLEKEQQKFLLDMVPVFKDMGLTSADIKSFILKSLYKGTAPSGAADMTVEELISKTRPRKLTDTETDDAYLSLGSTSLSKDRLLKNDILYTPLRDAMQTNMDSKITITPKKSGGTSDLPDEPKRQYALDKYIESMEKENRLMQERVPYYREYIEIQQMLEEDITPDDKGLAMDKAKAKTLAEKAKALYDLREAYKYVDEGYLESIAIQQQFSKAPEKALQDSLDKLKSTERTATYENEVELIELLLTLAQNGSSLSEVAESVNSINNSFKDTKKGTVATALKNDSFKTITGLGLDPNINEDMLDLIIRLSNVSDTYLEEVLDLSLGEDKYTSAVKMQEKELRKLFDARSSLIAQGKDIAVSNAAMHEFATANVSAGFTDVGSGVGAFAAKAAFSQMSSGDPNNTTSTQSLDEQLADWKAAEDKLKQYKEAVANTGGYSPGGYIDSEVIATAATEVERLAKAYGVATQQAAVLANVTGKVMHVLASASADAALDSFYELGYSLSNGSREMKSLAEITAEWGKTILNQLPSIFLQGAMASFALGAPGIPGGVAFLAAALGTSFLGGMAQSKETQKAEQNKDSDLLANLQDQMQRMLEQFRQSILYLEVARSKYIADSSLALSPYALGGTFNGTGLSHGIYQQPTYFNAYAKGDSFNSVMGESGAEAILPLRRGPTGQLGVISGGKEGSGTILLNITNTSDTKVSSTSVTASDGVTEISLLLEKVVVGTLASGKADSVLRSRYNVASVGRY